MDSPEDKAIKLIKDVLLQLDSAFVLLLQKKLRHGSSMEHIGTEFAINIYKNKTLHQFVAEAGLTEPLKRYSLNSEGQTALSKALTNISEADFTD